MCHIWNILRKKNSLSLINIIIKSTKLVKKFNKQNFTIYEYVLTVATIE